MGNTYGFTKVDRAGLFSKKYYVPPEESCGWMDNDPLYLMFESNDICGEMDRDDYLFTLLKKEDGDENLVDDDLKESIKRVVVDEKWEPLANVNGKYIIKPAVERAIKTLKELDAKVLSMCELIKKPWPEYIDWQTFGVALFDATEESFEEFSKKYGYVEERPREEYEKCSTYSHYFYGWCKEVVDVLKEVYKVYDTRYGHYTFPWEVRPDIPWNRFGSVDMQENLQMLLDEMNADKENKFVFFLYWC